MKTLFLASHFIDYSFEAASAMAQRGPVLLLCDRQKAKFDLSEDQTRNLPGNLRLRFFRQGKFQHRWSGVARVLAEAIAFRPDIVIVHEHAHQHVTVMHRMLRRLAKVVLVVHDPKPHAGRDAELAKRNAKQIQRQRANASACLVHGQHCYDLLRPQIPASKRLFNIAHGPILRPMHTRENDAQRLLMFGRMEEYKGVDVLVDALKILRAREVKFEARFVGSGPEIKRLKPEIAAISGCSVLDHFISRDDAVAEIAAAGVVVAPYREATQSGVVAGAFAHYKPVIATRVGGLPDVVRHEENGLLIEPNDPAALADAIEQFLDDPALRMRLRAGAKQAVFDLISWNRFADAVVALAQGKTTSMAAAEPEAVLR